MAAVDAALAEIGAQSGPGSQGRRRELLAGSVRGRDRRGAGAAARAAQRRASPGRAGRPAGRRDRPGLRGDVARGAAGAAAAGDLKASPAPRSKAAHAALAEFGLQVGRPLTPMLAAVRTDGRGRRSTATGMPAVAERSSTAFASRCIGTADRCGCSPAASTTSPPACRRVVAAVRCAAGHRRSCSTARRSAKTPSGRPSPVPGDVVTRRPAVPQPDRRRAYGPTSSTYSTSTASTSSTSPGATRWARLARVVPPEMLVGRTPVADVEQAAGGVRARPSRPGTRAS